MADLYKLIEESCSLQLEVLDVLLFSAQSQELIEETVAKQLIIKVNRLLELSFVIGQHELETAEAIRSNARHMLVALAKIQRITTPRVIVGHGLREQKRN